jgi:hypothetical protein
MVNIAGGCSYEMVRLCVEQERLAHIESVYGSTGLQGKLILLGPASVRHSSVAAPFET